MSRKIVRFAYDVAIDDPDSDLHAVQMATESLAEDNAASIKEALVVVAVLDDDETDAGGKQ